MRNLFGHILMLLLLPGLIACGDDEDYVYPSVVTTFVDLHTDTSGVATTLTTDEGRTWNIHPRDGLDGLTPDTTYRMVTMYEPLDNEVQLYTAQKAISPVPKLLENVAELHTDPVALTSIWRGGSYLNLIVTAQVKDQSHTYHFIDRGITTDEADGHHCLDLLLFHDRNNDVEAFTRKVYLSIPLQEYADRLTTGDSIRFTLMTYKEGETTRTFPW